MTPETALTLLINRWRDWQEIAPYQLPAQQEAERQNILKMFMLYKRMKKKKNKICQTSEPFFQTLERVPDFNTLTEEDEKIVQGDNTLIVHMQPTDYENYFEYIRMDVETYNELFKLIEPRIKKQFLIKYPIPAHTRLQICLRYLASGDSMSIISHDFGVSSNAVSKIVTETCEALWDVLNELVLPLPTANLWKEKAQCFEAQWDFVNCIGTIDKKQLIFQTGVPTESSFCKSNETLVLFAITDANSCFSLISIGIEEMTEYGIDFSKSEMGQCLQNNTYDIPQPIKDEQNGSELPYVLVGDEDFPLTSNMLLPYAKSTNLDLPQQVFNYRIGRVRKCSDCAFQILTSQWKIFQKKFSTNVINTIKITKAAICLHNFLMMKENLRPFQDRRYSLLSDKNLTINGCYGVNIYSESSNEEAEKVRNTFKELFCEDGAILLEWE